MSTATPGSFYEVNPATGAATAVGAQGEEVTGLAGACSGTIFGLGAPGETGNDFVTIDTATGAATVVGSLGTVSAAEGAIDFAADATLWGIESGGDVFTIDPSTGAATVVGSTVVGFTGLAISPLSCPPPPPPPAPTPAAPSVVSAPTFTG